MYDGVLRVRLSAGTTSVAFADDLANVALANTKRKLMEKINVALRELSGWLADHSLKLAPEKTEAIFLKEYRRKHDIVFRLGQKEIRPAKRLKYLGIVPDRQNTYKLHVQEQCVKAERRMAALMRIMPNTGGPGTRRRILLYNVVQPILLYAAPV